MNWNLLCHLAAVLIIKLIGSSLFLLYSSQIFQEGPKATNGGKTSCLIGWDLYEGKCYYFSNIEKTWDESQNNCASSYTHLAVVSNKAELTFLMNRTKSAYYFIGLTKRGSTGQWTWIDNTAYAPNLFHMSTQDFGCGTVGLDSKCTVNICSIPDGEGGEEGEGGNFCEGRGGESFQCRMPQTWKQSRVIFQLMNYKTKRS